MVDLKTYIEEKSRELKIDLIGFTDGNPLLNIEDYLNYRVNQERTTEFEERDLLKRIDPRLTLPSCRSIIVIAMSYKTDYKYEGSLKPRGIISKSSWGRDYHLVLRERLKALIEEIKKKEEFEYRYFVDTGPLVDRELAKKAGLGAYGKNCSIINKDYGSFIFLGYILTDLDLEVNQPSLKDPCGDCDLCLRACPTGALEDPYKLNPKLCISYLSQTKDLIPEELRSKMANKIYGCDTCQNVCPRNKGVKISIQEDFLPLDTEGIVDIEELLKMSNREFKNKYGSLAGSWRGRQIWVRNAIIALANSKNKAYIPLLEDLKLRDQRWLEYIDWAIEEITDS